MNKVPYFLFLLLFLLHPLISFFGLPQFIKWVPELFSAILLVALLLRFAGTKTLNVPAKYLLLFGLFLIHVMSGIVFNEVGEGPIIPGLRYYLKFFPLFLLPIVFNFSDVQIKSQLKVLLAIGLLEVIYCFYQRFVEVAGSFSGDAITGTLTDASVISVYLVSCIIILMGFFIKQKISGIKTISLGILMLLPGVLSETKGAIVLLPIGLLTVVIFASRSKQERKKTMLALSGASIAFILFFAAYDSLYSKTHHGELAGQLFDPDRLTHYLYRGIDYDPDILRKQKSNNALISESSLAKAAPTRIDWLVAPIVILKTEPTKLYFGLGIGNISTFYSKDFEGEYAYLNVLVNAENTSLSLMLWEIGLGGVLIYFILFFFIFSDSLQLSRHNTLPGWIAAGWLGVIAVIVCSLPYKNITGFNTIGYLFFYWSGYIVASRFRISPDTNAQNLEIRKKSYLVQPLLDEKLSISQNTTI